jgi:hypothetical protein
MKRRNKAPKVRVVCASVDGYPIVSNGLSPYRCARHAGHAVTAGGKPWPLCTLHAEAAKTYMSVTLHQSHWIPTNLDSDVHRITPEERNTFLAREVMES